MWRMFFCRIVGNITDQRRRRFYLVIINGTSVTAACRWQHHHLNILTVSSLHVCEIVECFKSVKCHYQCQKCYKEGRSQWKEGFICIQQGGTYFATSSQKATTSRFWESGSSRAAFFTRPFPFPFSYRSNKPHIQNHSKYIRVTHLHTSNSSRLHIHYNN